MNKRESHLFMENELYSVMIIDTLNDREERCQLGKRHYGCVFWENRQGELYNSVYYANDLFEAERQVRESVQKIEEVENNFIAFVDGRLFDQKGFVE